MAGGRRGAKTWGQMNCSLWRRRTGAQQGWLCFKDRHSTFSHREEFRSIFADCTMDLRASACSDHSWHHRESLASKEMERKKQ